MTKTVKPEAQGILPRLRPLSAAVLSMLSTYQVVAAEVESSNARFMVAPIEFEKEFLAPGSSAATNLSRFEKGDTVLPGTYNVDVYVNERWVGRIDVPFKEPDGLRGSNARACFDKPLLLRTGVDLTRLASATVEALDVPGACLPIEQVIDSAKADFDFGTQRLDLTIQQMSLSRNPRGYVGQAYWDSGVNAAFLGYDTNVYMYNSHGAETQTQGYVGLSAGMNLGPWHFRHDGSYNWSSQSKGQYQSLRIFVQRDVPRLSSQLTLGESYTTGELFDSVAFRGARLASDDRMLPDSLRGYAPTVRGVANSNARVTIRQNGATIYETVVAPGAFEINDLYATGYGGDLKVDVTEADGRVHSFSVPYAALPLSLRPGISRYSITAGTLRDASLSGNPPFIQGTWQRGFTNALTGYVGAAAAEGYATALVGGVLATKVGAFSFDYTQSNALIPGSGRMVGGSMRIGYSKNLPQTGSDISIAAYRYSTGGFLDLVNAMQMRDASKRGLTAGGNVVRPRNRAQATISQSLGQRGGVVSLTASTVNYWNRAGSDINYSVGYSNTIRNISVNLQATRQQMQFGRQSTLYYASLTIPLGRDRPLTISSSVSRDTSGSTQVRTTMTGSLGADRNLSYGVNVNHVSGNDQGSTSGSANALYHGRVADISASAGTGKGYSQGSLGVRGALVAHPGGITLSQPVSETFGIVEAKNAQGARVLNSSGLRVDGRGYAIVPYLTPYSVNSVDIDPKGLSTDVELKSTSQQIAPRAGAIVMLKYETEMGRSAVIHTTRSNGKPLPFGADVIDVHGKRVGIVGQASKIFARGLEDRGELSVRWGEEPDARCRITYDLPVREKHSGSDSYQRVDALCRSAEPPTDGMDAAPGE